jgi:hypothetical protein
MTLLSLCGPRCAPPMRADVLDAATRNDPTKTVQLRARMRSEGDQRWQNMQRTLRQALIEHDLVGMTGVGRLPFADKTEGFAAWLREELRHKVFGLDGSWVKPYVRQAAAVAQKHAEDHAPGGIVDFGRINTMENLAVIELRGIVEAAQQQITRVATQSMMVNDTPTNMANALSGVINTMRNRTRAMSEYTIAKTHATSTLSAYQNAGVELVGLIPERLRHSAHGMTDALPSIRVPISTLIARARRWWRSRAVKLVKQYGSARALERLEQQLQAEETRLTGAVAGFRKGLRERGDVFIARRQAEGEAARAASALIREDIRQHYAALVSKTGGWRPGPGTRSSREETPSAGVIAEIEKAQRRLEATLGGGGEVDVLTAGDEDVCFVCQDISDEGPYSLAEAESLIPAHPWCRCAFVPAGKYEKDAQFAQILNYGDEEAGHPFRGNQWIAGQGGGPETNRAFKGQQVATKTKLSKLETGALGEKIVADFAKERGLKDVQSLNIKGNNFPIDLISPSGRIAFEVKSGLVSNGRSAQQWRATIGQPGPSEAKWLSTASDKQKAAWNEEKSKAILDRKNQELRGLSKELGTKLDAKTVGVIINPDSKTADIHVFNGFHSRIGWNTPEAKKGYVGTVKYRGKR